MIALPRRSRLVALGALVAALIALAATVRVDDVQAVSYKSCVLSAGFARPAGGTPVLFYGTFNCTYGKRAVRSSYQQNTD